MVYLGTYQKFYTMKEKPIDRGLALKEQIEKLLAKAKYGIYAVPIATIGEDGIVRYTAEAKISPLDLSKDKK